MRSWVLGTGSRGNAVLLEADGAYVLVDAGFPVRDLVRRLRRIGVAPTSIEAVVVTHEHTDHSRGAATGARAFGWPLYASPRTVGADTVLRAAGAMSVDGNATIGLSTMDLTTVPVPHDAAQPVAVVATAHRTGARTGVAYDLGHVTAAIRSALAHLDVLILEANHDEDMLRAGPYPPTVVDRIAGRHGHLSNRAAAELACAIAHRGLRRLVVAHLSTNCNDPGLATRVVAAALGRTRCSSALVTAALQDAVTGPFTAASSSSAAASSCQLSLAF
jgi:phosphoribosyl 1,2-cyclic phosphodiesterase